MDFLKMPKWNGVFLKYEIWKFASGCSKTAAKIRKQHEIGLTKTKKSRKRNNQLQRNIQKHQSILWNTF